MTAAIRWPDVLAEARQIVGSYSTSVTLRQLFYRLVSAQSLPNTVQAYKGLSHHTAEARRCGRFPALIDRGRIIHRAASWAGPAAAMQALVSQYRVDRTTGQPVSLYLAVEKAGLVVQLQSWFGRLGVPVLALGGYSSQTYADDVAGHATAQDRPAVLLYGGDHDPSGEDIDRDFVARTGCWAEVRRVALTARQVADYDLPVNPGKAADSRAAGFAARHGELRQVELDALDPDDLRDLFAAAVEDWWDTSAYDAAMLREDGGRAELTAAMATLGGAA
jgi:hypothetical protein